MEGADDGGEITEVGLKPKAVPDTTTAGGTPAQAAIN